MKAGQLRCWWENPSLPEPQPHKLNKPEEETGLAPVYSLAMHPDALWALAGTKVRTSNSSVTLRPNLILTNDRQDMSTCSLCDMSQEGCVML